MHHVSSDVCFFFRAFVMVRVHESGGRERTHTPMQYAPPPPLFLPLGLPSLDFFPRQLHVVCEEESGERRGARDEVVWWCPPGSAAFNAVRTVARRTTTMSCCCTFPSHNASFFFLSLSSPSCSLSKNLPRRTSSPGPLCSPVSLPFGAWDSFGLLCST